LSSRARTLGRMATAVSRCCPSTINHPPRATLTHSEDEGSAPYGIIFDGL
jgi:hypothetical protein